MSKKTLIQSAIPWPIKQFRISDLSIHLNKHLRNKIHRVSQNKSLLLKLKKVYIIRNIRPSNRDDVERVQHFMKWQAMALPPAQELTTLISEGNKMTWAISTTPQDISRT
jgi:hypothetical protein